MSNTLLRTYVTRVAFSMTLSSRMVEGLAEVWLMSSLNSTTPHRKEIPKEVSSHWVPIMRALGDRGLVVHTDPTTMVPPWSRYCWALTKAGEHMCGLLVEAGMIQPLQQRIALLGENIKQYKRKSA